MQAGQSLLVPPIVRPAAGWKNPRSARPRRATTSPSCSMATWSSSADATVRPGMRGMRRTRCARPVGPRTRRSVEPSSAGSATGTGRSGSTAAICATAATSISTTPRSSAALETFRTRSPPVASVRRKFWSRSLTSARAGGLRCRRASRATSSASVVVRAGGAAARTSAVVIGAIVLFARDAGACAIIGNRHPRPACFRLGT